VLGHGRYFGRERGTDFTAADQHLDARCEQYADRDVDPHHA
jgi:hypothetical protein